MSNPCPSLWEESISAFDENLFRREDDLLNVFRSTSQNESLYADQKVEEAEGISCLSYSHNHLPLFDYCSKEDKDFKTSMEFFGTGNNRGEEPSGHAPVMKKETLVCETAKEVSQVAFTDNTRFRSGNDNSNSDNTFSNSLKTVDDLEGVSSEAKSQDPKKEKLFSKRKDVIIKALLRKWKKFFLKDFNSKTSYLRRAKRKFGSSAYRCCLESYITEFLRIPLSEDMLVFLGVFLYQKDLEDNIDLFISPNYSPLGVKSLATEVHEVLYKYSHKKFERFSKNREFKYVFTYFEASFSDEIQKEELSQEYSLGLEIIRDQL